jgi:hypothetical protein
MVSKRQSPAMVRMIDRISILSLGFDDIPLKDSCLSREGKPGYMSFFTDPDKERGIR